MLQENEPEQNFIATAGEVENQNEVIVMDSDTSVPICPIQVMTSYSGKRTPKESTSQSTKKQRFRKLKDMAELLVRDFDYDIIIFAYAPNKHRGTSFGNAYGENANRLLNEEEIGKRWKNEWMELSSSFAKRKHPVVSPSTPFETSALDNKVSTSAGTVVESTPLSEAAVAAASKKANDQKARLNMLAENRRRKTAERKAEWAKLINSLTKSDPQSLKSKAKSELRGKEKDRTLKRNNAQKHMITTKTVRLNSFPEKRNAAVDDRSSTERVTCTSVEPHHTTDAELESDRNTVQEPKKPKVQLQSRTSLALKSHQKPIVLKLIRAEEVPQNSNLIEIRNVIANKTKN